jgi:hypothetical protein
MSDWRVWALIGAWCIFNAGWTLFCLEYAYRKGCRDGQSQWRGEGR